VLVVVVMMMTLLVSGKNTSSVQKDVRELEKKRGYHHRVRFI